MRIAITLTPPKDLYFKWAAQTGVTDYVARYPRHYGEDPIDGLTAMRDRAGSFGSSSPSSRATSRSTRSSAAKAAATSRSRS
jgi:hypothetical protein